MPNVYLYFITIYPKPKLGISKDEIIVIVLRKPWINGG